MCGLVGFVSTDVTFQSSFNKRKFLKEGLYVTALRGMDSTGIAFVRKKNINFKTSVEIYKEAVPAFEFLAGGKFNKAINTNFNEVVVALGHARAATIGEVSDNNAHPFRRGAIILTHNGTLDKVNNDKEMSNFATDSDWICHLMSTKGHRVALEQIVGDYAVAWYNNITKQFSMARNDKRTLFFAYGDNPHTLIYSSDREMLKLLAARSGLGLHENKIFSVIPGKIITFNITDLKHTVTDFTEKKPSYSTYYGYADESDFRTSYTNNKFGVQHAGCGRSGFVNTARTSLQNKGYIYGDPIIFKLTEVMTRTSRAFGVSTDGKGIQICVGHYDKKDFEWLNAHINKEICADISYAEWHDKNSLMVWVRAASLSDISPKKPLNNVIHLSNKSKKAEVTEADKDMCQQGEDDEHAASNIEWIPFRGDLITEAEFKEKVACSCSWCTSPLTVDDAYDVVWTRSREPICRGCYEANPGLDDMHIFDEESFWKGCDWRREKN